ncbi:hypothetical protein Aduo_000165 [Ancylostoma duodenale]
MSTRKQLLKRRSKRGRSSQN